MTPDNRIWTFITLPATVKCDPQLSSVTRNCQICIMQLNTLKTGIFKSKEFMNGIIIRRNFSLNNTCSFNSPHVRFKETRFVISLLTRNCQVHCMFRRQIIFRSYTHLLPYIFNCFKKKQKMYLKILFLVLLKHELWTSMLSETIKPTSWTFLFQLETIYNKHLYNWFGLDSALNK